MVTPAHLARIAVIGTSGSGKTTVARALSAQLDVPHIEVDANYWGPNWTPIDESEFREKLDRQTSQPAWVCDGNYRLARDLIWPRASAIVWLNYSLPRVFGRALRRTLGRCMHGTPLFGGNRETFRQSFFSRDSILIWVLRTHWRHQHEYPRQFAEAAHNHLHIVELRNTRETDRLLAEVAEIAASRRLPATGG